MSEPTGVHALPPWARRPPVGPQHDLGAGDCEAPEARLVFPALSRSCPVCQPPSYAEPTPDPWQVEGPTPPPPF